MEPPATTRLKLTVHYDGSGFHGWQLQPDHRTVQGELERALSRLADSPRRVLSAGRTDAGVHATGQVAAVDMPSSWTADRVRRSLNAVLPADVWIERAAEASPEFHPRFDALARSYSYTVGLRPEAASPFHRRWCWPLCAPLDARRLRRTTRTIVGEHSFRAFSKAGQPERGERCRVAEASWSEHPIGVELRITADRYLHHMVRYLVGTLVDVARGRRPSGDVARLLHSDPDLTTSPPAPPQGLFLRSVTYAESAPHPHSSKPSSRRSPSPA